MSNTSSVFPFYSISNYELLNDILFRSRHIRDDKLNNTAFYNALKDNSSSDILHRLSFNYFTDDALTHAASDVQNRMNLSIFHFNVRSLNKNCNELYTFLFSLDVNFDVLVISEIWSVNLELFRNAFPGNSFYYDAPGSGIVGGVGVFVRNCYSCNVIDTLKVINSDYNRVENIWIEISNSTSKYIIGAFYRHPNHDIHDFTLLLENSLCSVSRRDVPCFVAGDFNIDLCNYKTHTATTEYVDMLLLNNFLPMIIMPTRITGSSASIIDQLITYITLKEIITRKIFWLAAVIFGVI